MGQAAHDKNDAHAHDRSVDGGEQAGETVAQYPESDGDDMPEQSGVAQARSDTSKCGKRDGGEDSSHVRQREEHNTQADQQCDDTQREQAANQQSGGCQSVLSENARYKRGGCIFQSKCNNVGNGIERGRGDSIHAVLVYRDFARHDQRQDKERDEDPQPIDLVQQVTGGRALEQLLRACFS